MAGRARSRRGEGDRLKADVLAAVNRLLAEWGDHEKLTMRAVAKEVGVAAPTIYLHFADKTELVWAALADKYEQLADPPRAARSSSTTRPRSARPSKNCCAT
ncbi:TetR/AcrR family transcriptional regulator [Amycolatopsis sp. NBC_01488]|uniref:TetR/AcrR family transcriptional regulator n=1 Tax=Amycolatopsis sp. NBC_01488 TaxID=2903563 RepID=UPI002E2C6A2F|nr:helix-turn-helix domain-containing protein [Amycolatopsis sp. NBC_01488]